MRALTTDNDPRQLRILANGDLVREIPLSQLPAEWQPFLLEVPIDPQSIGGGGMLLLTLELESLRTPVVTEGSSSSQRSRGIAVKSLTLETGA